MRLFPLITTLLLLSACQTVPHSSTQIEGKTWLLTQLVQANIPLSGKAHLSFQSPKITGNAGCNHFFASYQHEASQLRISQIGSTKMYCGNMAEEQAFLSRLSKVHHYQVINKTLHMFSETDELLLVFKQNKP